MNHGSTEPAPPDAEPLSEPGLPPELVPFVRAVHRVEDAIEREAAGMRQALRELDEGMRAALSAHARRLDAHAAALRALHDALGLESPHGL